jgi:cyclomaltodextrinase / maltogenic alpha-amylase / neopullulanase
MAATSQPPWVQDAIFYQIFPDRFANGDRTNDPSKVAAWGDLPTRTNFFGGDLQGIMDHLDYFQELGINAIYLTPIFKSPSNHKYDTTDYFQIDPAFGSMSIFKQLVNKLHQQKMHIILDGVFNHCGLTFPPFQDLILKGAKSSYKDWFTVRSFPITESPLSYMTCGGAPFLPKLNHQHRAVRDFILKVARYWIEETGIDGWRLDVPFKVPIDFWRDFRETVRSINKEIYLVGEVWREPKFWVSNGDIFDGVTNYSLRELLMAFVNTRFLDAEDFAFETEQLSLSLGSSEMGMLNLLSSHDTPRVLTLLRGDIDLLRIMCTYIFTNPGAPLIYYGDEIGILGDNDPDCRRPMIWKQENWNSLVVDIYRQLIRLRSLHPALRRGVRKTLLTFNGVFVYKMSLEADEVIVILNPREALTDIHLNTFSSYSDWRDESTGREYHGTNGNIVIDHVPALSSHVLLPANQLISQIKMTNSEHVN